MRRLQLFVAEEEGGDGGGVRGAGGYAEAERLIDAIAGLDGEEFLECPDCVPGSGKPVGHRGAHRLRPLTP